MAKATITTRSGAAVTVEGTESEVARLVSLLDADHDVGGQTAPNPRPASRARAQARPTPKALITDLIEGGFFSQPKGLGEVKATLEEQGHFYPVTSLSPLMLRMVRQKELRRLKERHRWVYVQ